MRVLVAHPSPDCYGADRMVHESLRRLRERGADLLFVCPYEGPLTRAVAAEGFEIAILPFPVLRKAVVSAGGIARLAVDSLRSLPRLRQLLHDWRADIAYANTITLPIWLLAARAENVPSICHVREAQDDIGRAAARVLLAPLRMANHIVANSRGTAAWVLDNAPRIASPVTVVYNGISFPAESTSRRPRGPRPRLLLAGRLNERKGQVVAIHALAELVRRGHDVELELAGSVFPGYEWYEQHLRTIVESHALDDRVQFTGFQTDIWSAYERADVVLVPSLIEPFGNVAVEAMACARPVVVSAVGGLPEIVRHNETGLLVPPNDAPALADAVSELLRDEDYAEAMARAGAASARDRFSAARYGDELEAVLTGVYRGHRQSKAVPVPQS